MEFKGKYRDNITSIFSNGRDQIDNFITRLVKADGSIKAFDDTIRIFPFQHFKETYVIVKVSRNEKQREFHIKRYNLGKLVSIFTT